MQEAEIIAHCERLNYCLQSLQTDIIEEGYGIVFEGHVIRTDKQQTIGPFCTRGLGVSVAVEEA